MEGGGSGSLLPPKMVTTELTVGGATTSTMSDQPSLNLVPPPPVNGNIHVFPPTVHFEGVQAGFAYVMTISIRNVGKDSRRIRMTIPHARSLFKVRYEPVPAVAMGLDMRAEVEFQITEDDVDLLSTQSKEGNMEMFTEKLLVSSGDEVVEVPLTAALPAPNLYFEPFVNLGAVVLDQSATKEVEVTNRGSRTGNFKITYDKTLPLRIRPTQIELEPGASTKLLVDIDAKMLGPLRALAYIEVDRQPKKILDINAQVVEQRLELVLEDGGGLLSSVEFGSLFYGQNRVVKALLVNNGPLPMAYSTTFTLHDIIHQKMTIPPNFRDAVGEDDNEEEFKAMAVCPNEGLIDAFGQASISFVFQPKERAFIKGFECLRPSFTRTVCMMASIEAPESNQKIAIQMTGRAVTPELQLSRSSLEFGECPLYQRKDVTLTLTNPTEIALPFTFPNLPLVHTQPTSGTVPPGQSHSVVVTYRPCQMGPLNKTLVVLGAQGILQLPLALTGRCSTIGTKTPHVGGIDCIPEDFIPKYQFVKEQEDPLQSDDKANGGASSSSSWKRSKPWEEVDLLVSASWDESEPASQATALAQYTFSVQELARRDEHRKKYTNYLKESYDHREQVVKEEVHKHRLTKLKRDVHDPEGVDLALSRALPEPALVLPKPSENLWLERPVGGEHTDDQGGHKKLPVDENRLITKKFKPNPTTQAEVRDCTKALSPQELLNIVPSTKVLDIGRVSVDSVVVKNFAVGNFLHHCVLVTLGTFDPELRGSGPTSQVVPEGLTAGFDIRFSSPAVGPVKRTVSYTLNGKHTFKFTVVADVVPLEVTLSTKEITLQFPDDCLEPAINQTFTLENPGTAACDFYWATRGAFTVRPEQGTIAAKSKLEAVVTWRPSQGLKNEDVLNLSVPGGKDTELKVIGICQEPKVNILDKKLEFGTIAVGLKQEKSIRLKNMGPVPAVVFFDGTNLRDAGAQIIVTPEVFRLGGGEVMDVKITLTPTAPRSHQGLFVTFNIRGGRNCRIPLVGESIVPDVKLAQEGFDFGGVVMGTDLALPLSLTNNGAIPANVILDLSQYMDFHLLHTRQDIKLVPTGAGGGEAALERVDMTTLVRSLSSLTDQPIDPEDEEAINPKDIHKWQFIIPASMTLSTSLTFQPDVAGKVTFALPMHLQGLPNDTTLTVPVKAHGLEPRIVMTSSTVDFGERVVSRSGGSITSYHQEVQFINTSRSGLTWQLDDAAIKALQSNSRDPHGPNIFFVSHLMGDLAPNESTTLRITFTPKNATYYTVNLPLYLANQVDRSRPYLNLRIRGTGIHPGLLFDRDEVVLPTVPLGVRSSTQFHVVNQGFANIELAHKLPAYTPVELQLEYPEGKLLGTGIAQVPITISYKSDKPVSFNVRLDFYDRDGNRFSVPVVGCADNCILTTSRFLSTYADRYLLFKRDGQPVTLYHQSVVKALKEHEASQRDKERQRRTQERLATIMALNNSGGSTSHPEGSQSQDVVESNQQQAKAPAKASKANGDKTDEVAKAMESAEEMKTDMGKQDPPYQERNLQQLAAWLNFNVMQNRIGAFPHDVIESHGRLAVEAIELMSGKTLNNKVKAVAPSRKDRIVQLMAQYEEMLVFLKEKGALLNTVAAECLLGREDYVVYKELKDEKHHLGSSQSRMTPSQAREIRSSWERAWGPLSMEAWVTVMYQAIRVFMLARVTPRSLSSLPGILVKDETTIVGNKKEEAALSTSNAYTISENLLLKWINYHVNATMPSLIKGVNVCDMERDLRDSAMLCHVLVSHLPKLKEQGMPLEGFMGANKVMELQSSLDHRLANAKRVIDALEIYKINYGLTPESITNGSGQDLMMLVLHLYQALPQFIPKANIEFKAVLGSLNRKVVELQNPNSFPIRYNVTLEGCKDFRIPQDTVELEPMKTMDFVVECEPRFSKEMEARLTFWVQRNGGRSASNLVFTLRSVVQSRQPLASFSYTANCYEATPVQVDLKNPFGFDSQFTLSTTQRFVEPLLFKVGGKNNKSKGQTSSKWTPPNPNMISATTDEEKEAVPLVTNPFFATQDVIRMRANDMGTVNLQLVGFFPGVYVCELVLLDANIGEFAVELVATIDMPKPLQKLTCDLSLEGNNLQRDLRLPSANPALQKAIATSLERLPINTRAKARQSLLNLLRPQVDHQGLATFRLEVDSPYWTCPPTVPMASEAPITTANTPSKAQAKATSLNRDLVASLNPPVVDPQADPSNHTTIMVNASEPGTYPCRLYLYPVGPTAVSDFRLYEVEASLMAAKIQTCFTFRAPARQTIVQEIPITNNGDTPWSLSASIEGSSAFTGDRTFIVPAKSRGAKAAKYRLSYTPAWLGQEQARLVFKSMNSNDSFEFQLTGVGEEPLAEKAVNITCKAREVSEAVIPVRNYLKRETVYKVESDLPYVGGDAELVVPANATADYHITIAPQLGGVYHGSITFTAPTGEYSWFPVEINAGSPAAESTVEVTAKVREAVAVELLVENPLNESLEFEVLLDGEYLLGDETFSIEASETKAYELIYSPLIPKGYSGSIAFVNPMVGEFWYTLKLSAVPADPIKLDQMSAAVGSTESTMVMIENPLGIDAAFAVTISNKRNFNIRPQQVTVAPYATTSLEIIYTPGSLSTVETSTITLTHPQVGTWEYQASGVGEMPGLMPTETPTSIVGQANSYMFAFRNPFVMPITVDVVLRIDDPLPVADASNTSQSQTTTEESSSLESLESSSLTDKTNKSSKKTVVEDPVFSLLMKKTTAIVVPAHTSIQIPMSFFPKNITARTGTVEVRTSYKGHDLTWVYPIRGIAEAPKQHRAFSFKCKAKRSLRQDIEVDLKGLEAMGKEVEEFNHELVIPPELVDMVHRSLTITPIKNIIFEKGDKLRYQVLFEPKKPFAATMELAITKPTGGRWRFEMRLEAAEPDPDDTIYIEAAINTTTILNFKLANSALSFAPFKAFFSTDSAYNITVTPSSGVLPPYGSDGVTFSLSFSPTEYGKFERARLFITTEEHQWTYEIKGTYPGFIPRNDIQPKVDTINRYYHMHKSMTQSISQVNIIRKNMTAKALHSTVGSAKRKKKKDHKGSPSRSSLHDSQRFPPKVMPQFGLTVSTNGGEYF